MPGVEQAGGVRPRRGTVGGHDHALARGQAVVLDHPGLSSARSGPNRSSAASRWAGLSTISLRGGAHPGGAITSLANDFEPSIRAASADGPKHAMPAARTASATPSTSGTSGPMTTRSAPDVDGEFGDGLAGGDVDVVLFGDRRGAGVARSGDQAVDFGIAPQRHQQRMFTGTGADHQDAHSSQP